MSTLARAASVASRNAGTEFGNDDPVDRGIQQRGFGPGHEQAVRHQREHPFRTGLAGGAGRAQERAARADEVVDDERCRSRHLADEQVTRDDARAAAFVGKGFAYRSSQRGFQRLAKQIGTLGSARIGRHNAERLVAQRLGVIDKQRCGCQRHRRAAKGVLEGCRIMHVQGDDGVRAYGREQTRHVARDHWIVGLCAPVLACVAEIRHQRRHSRGTAVPERADEEQEPAQLVIGALLGSAVQALQYENVGAAHRHEGTRLVFAILEFPLLMRRQRPVQRGGHR